MNNPFLNTLRLRLIYVGSWAMIIIAQLLILFYYFGIPAGESSIMRITDSITGSVLQAVCILGLWHPVRFYGNIKNGPLFLLFHLTLFLLSCILWIGLSYCIIRYLILPNSGLYTPYFIAVLPVRIVAGIFTYIIFILAYYLLQIRNELTVRKFSAEEKTVASLSPAPVEKLSRIIVKKNSEFHCILVNQIYYIEANGDYVIIYTDSSRYLKDQTMKYWETHLPDECFVRIHRSFIVNIEMIAKIELYEKETYKVHLKNGNTLKASSAGYKLLRQKMDV